MNYKELLDRYKKNLVSEEEKQLVEQELEKQEAFEEYISENLDEEFNKLETISSIKIYDEETIKLKKSVNKRLRKVIITSVLAVVILYIGVFYVISGIIDKVYYDPTSITQSDENKQAFPDFIYDMHAYTSLNMPGYSMSLPIKEPKGFGNYAVSYSMKELFTKEEQRYFFNLSKGRLTSTMDGIFSTKNIFGIWKGFKRIQDDVSKGSGQESATTLDGFTQEQNEETMRYLNGLNPLSYISMDIVFNEDMTMEEFHHMSNEEYDEINFKWVGIRTVEPGTQWSENQPMHLIGFNPNFNDEGSFNGRPDSQKYPLFYLSDISESLYQGDKVYTEIISEAYGIHFKSRLQYLRNREDFIEIFDYNDFKIDFYDDALEYIDKHGVNTYGVLAYGTAAEFLKYIDKIPYDSIYINEVLPAKPNIYYD